MAKIENIYDCLKVRTVLDHIMDKWSVLVVGLLSSQPRRFNQIKKEISGVSQKSLTHCLRNLERSGLIERTVIDGAVLGVEYSLTSLGESMHEPMSHLFILVCDNTQKIDKAQKKFDERKVKQAARIERAVS